MGRAPGKEFHAAAERFRRPVNYATVTRDAAPKDPGGWYPQSSSPYLERGKRQSAEPLDETRQDVGARPVLIRIAITNLATIESLALEFREGFTVLTGETGAGKSILLDAIRFVLGGKASGEQVRTGARQTLVEAVFHVADQPDVLRVLEELGIPCLGELTVRRILGETGRSRALANDCAITQNRLEELGEYLVNIHGQHDNQRLLNPTSHINYLDAMGELELPRTEVGREFHHYTALLRDHAALRERLNRRDEERATLTATVEELRAANLQAGEEEELRSELMRLTHAERLTALTGQVLQWLYEGEHPVLERIKEIEQALSAGGALDPRLKEQAEPVGPIRFQLEDLYQAVRGYAGRLEAEPNRLETVNARLALIEKLRRRHGGTVEAALARLTEAETELAALEGREDSLKQLETKIAQVAARLHALSMELTRRRQETAALLDRQVESQLRALGMEKAEFATRITPLASPTGKTPYYTAHGMDQVEFQLNTNPGQKLRPLARIASGGELSRTMLALKTVLARQDQTASLIFDEVDAGISGRVAEIVGRKLRALSTSHQVLCVTHLPQIAALGHNHVRVSKDTRAGATFTEVESLSGAEQVREIARLLSGMEISEHSMATAREMVSRGKESRA